MIVLRRKALRVVEKNLAEVAGIALRQYPPFVLSDSVGELHSCPVFGFHAVTESALRPVLEYLVENRYETLTADEYVARRRSGDSGRPRAVLLTFDDGHESLYRVAFPLLRELGLRAVAYVVPGEIPDAPASAGWRTRLCTWTQVQEVHESGIIDVQSHSMYHRSIPISSRVADFVRPGVPSSFLDSDLWPVVWEDGHARPADDLPFGTPLCVWRSRFSAHPAIRTDPMIAAECSDYVRARGGSSFFADRSWQRQLRRIVEARRQRDERAVTETPEIQRQAIRDDLAGSKALLESRLANKVVRHFCYPWYRGSVLAVELCREVGYVSNAWGSLLPSFAVNETAPLPLARLAAHYLWRLPGKGRRSLPRVLRQRLTEASHIAPGAHA